LFVTNEKAVRRDRPRGRVACLTLLLRVAAVALVFREQAHQKTKGVLRLVVADVVHPFTIVRCIAGFGEHGTLL
jgi:hypothetical protein